MGPFSIQLREYRKRRGISTKTLAANIGVSDKILSAIETGRRRPPTGAELRALCASLGLSSQESRALEEAASDSASRIQIPPQATPDAYRLVHRLVRSLCLLSSEQIAAVHAVLNQPMSADREGLRGGSEMS